MKKRYIICICLIAAITIIMSYFKWQFKKIEISKSPYISNKKQFMEIFNQNNDLFNKFVEIIENTGVDKDIIYQYNSSTNSMDIGINNDEIQNIVSEMVINVGITNIEKYGEYITLYQYEPIAFSDIKIGMKYSISDKAWTYYYDHNYDDCCHDHKVVYRVYDFLFN